MRLHNLKPVPARSTAPSGSVKANPAATAKPPVAVARARPRVPAARSASVSKAARCRSSAAFPSAVSNNARFTTAYSPVNVGDLNQFEDGARVDETALRSVGLANGPKLGIKILGTGDLTKKLVVIVSAISASAKTKIEAKGGSVELIAKKSSAAAKK